MKTVFKLFSHAPLVLLHALGCGLGLLVVLASGVYRRRMLINTSYAGVSWRKALHAALHAGCVVAELPRVWLGLPVRVRWKNKDVMDAVFEKSAIDKTGLIFLTPHIGSWEVAGQAIAQACNAVGKEMTVMYRPARQAWLDAIVRASRARPGMRTVTADASGVRQTLRALKEGRAIGLLPDQVPPLGMGVWATMFGQAAYSTTLAARLAQMQSSDGARPQVIMVMCRRLNWGRGFEVCVNVVEMDALASVDAATQQVNHAVEQAILANPEQYLWGYARYKQPRKDA